MSIEKPRPCPRCHESDLVAIQGGGKLRLECFACGLTAITKRPKKVTQRQIESLYQDAITKAGAL